MIVCHEKRFIFIAVNKTASSSIHTAFREAGVPIDKVTARDPQDERLHHASARHIRELVGEEVWRSYFKFAFVRNPWDRLFSYYNYFRSSPWVTVDDTGARISPSFAKWIANGRYPRKSQRALVADDNGGIAVDYLGRFEYLESHFCTICDIIGIQRSLPWINSHG